LLDDDDMFTPAFESALKEIFARFDADGDGYLSLDELHAFARTTNDADFDQDTLDQLSEFFAEPTKKPALMVAEEGFLDMYHLQTQNDEDETWKDLGRLGYDFEL
ncbi:hypothetical protein BC828DRAFT_332435, partial [Blastocladiella britannica]